MNYEDWRINILPTRLTEARKQSGLEQKELAQKIGHVGQGQISHFETGRSSPGLRTLFKLSEALEQPMNFFFEETKDPA